MKPRLSYRGAFVTLTTLLLFPFALRAQVPDSVQAVSTPQEVPDTLAGPPEGASQITPGGAFLRSALIPGWGHAKVGALGRGAFYFTLESAAVFMFLKSQSRLSLARDRVRMREEVATARLQSQGMVDPLEIEEALAADEEMTDLRGLETARSEQREDWMAVGIFFLFLGGADAFVSAHLAEFPTPVEVGFSGTPEGRVGVAVSIPVGF